MTPRRPDRSAVAAAAQAHETAVRAARAERAPNRLPLGQFAYDTRRERRGVVMDHFDGLVWLRPPGGGMEWTARPDEVEPAASILGDELSGAVLRVQGAVSGPRGRRELS
ncbi:hypothetical protein I3F60_19420 [Streptomyces sp. MUM 136J]|uniref:hypothetical protein n=1 Tax=Streptomyces sp. MUM 136J TaxID=2791992 RepID=UPI001F04E2F6|nr:hypothetical protein [Streptomyces sp. MUM 136J]MCH0571408.1 hypothetical protein [Streptomyces sp. MUM 136J]